MTRAGFILSGVAAKHSWLTQKFQKLAQALWFYRLMIGND
jgi:hypothetical protein